MTRPWAVATAREVAAAAASALRHAQYEVCASARDLERARVTRALTRLLSALLEAGENLRRSIAGGV
jgi:hypothetical protein